MENVIMRLRCPKKHPFLVKHALGTMFNHFVFKWNGFMIPTWLAHGTEYMQLRMQREFSCFLFCFCFVEENARMSKHENKWYAILQIKKFVERICMTMPWLMQNVRLEYDNGQMQDMSIMMLWRDAYAMHDMNAFYGHESPENHLFLLAHLGRSAPCVQLRRWYGPSGFPWQRTRPTYNAC